MLARFGQNAIMYDKDSAPLLHLRTLLESMRRGIDPGAAALGTCERIAFRPQAVPNSAAACLPAPCSLISCPLFTASWSLGLRGVVSSK